MQIVLGAPLWVWPVLAVLLAAGIAQMRARSVPRAVVLGVPAVLTVLSLGGVLSSFGASAAALAAWLAGAVAALALNERLLGLPRGVRRVGGDRYAVPGSVVPLLLMLAIFATRFAVGAAAAVAPALVGGAWFVAGVGAVLGLLGGLFLARAWRILRAGPAAALTRA
jgi:hypothetical protein